LFTSGGGGEKRRFRRGAGIIPFPFFTIRDLGAKGAQLVKKPEKGTAGNAKPGGYFLGCAGRFAAKEAIQALEVQEFVK